MTTPLFNFQKDREKIMIYPQDFINKIILGDCLEVMKDIPDKSIDMILCDLPYGITACKWDTVIPFEPLWGQYKRIIKENGCIALSASQPFTSKLVMSNIKWYKHHWIWLKNRGTGFQIVKYRPMMQTEDIIVFCKGKVRYNPQKIKFAKPVIYTFATSTRGTNPLANINKSKHIVNGKWPTNVIYCKNLNRKKHPTQKPVELFEYLIKTYTNENDLVLDNCIGSGTTAIACLETNRRYIGIEKELKYVEIARERIEGNNKI